MSEPSAPAVSPADIEARQDDLLRQLDELENRIARVLAEYSAYGKSPVRPVTGGGPVSRQSVAAETRATALPLSAAVVPTVGAATALG